MLFSEKLLLNSSYGVIILCNHKVMYHRHVCNCSITRNTSQNVEVKVKVTFVQALRLCTGRTACRGSRGIALPFHDYGTRRESGVSFTPRPLFTPGKTQYPLYRMLVGPHGRSGHPRKISPPPVFDLRTVQPVVSRYTVYATRPITKCKYISYNV